MSTRLAVCLSGGGHRAALFGLGALLYLGDSGQSRHVVCVSSVSGGSLTNGYVGLRTEFDKTDGPQLRAASQPLLRALCLSGTLWAGGLTYAYLVTLLGVVAAAIVLTVILGEGWPWLIWTVAVPLLGWLLSKRGWLARRAFDSELFKGAALADLHTGVDHVITATDLQLKRQVFFSSRFVYSYAHRWGAPGKVTLAFAVQASSCFPGAFPPSRRSVADHRFTPVQDPAENQHVLNKFMLVDGGVYDNMGTEWVLRLSQRITEGHPPDPVPALPDHLLVVNASAGVRNPSSRRLVPIPFVGEAAALLADTDVLYAQSTAVRRRWLNALFTLPGGEKPAEAGAIIQIDRSPFELPIQFSRPPEEPPDDKSVRAAAALNLLTRAGPESHAEGGPAAAWANLALTNSRIPTKLSKIEPDAAAAVLRHAYVLTMVNTHVLLGYPLGDIPTLDSFRQLIQ